MYVYIYINDQLDSESVSSLQYCSVIMFRKNGKPSFWEILPLSQNEPFFPQFAL